MKKFTVIGTVSLIVLLTISVALFWPPTVVGTTIFQLSGTAGTIFTGYYVQDGRRVPVSGVLPRSFDSAGVSKFEFRKIHPDQRLAFAAQYDETAGAHAMQLSELAPGVLGIRGQVQNHGLRTIPFDQ
jgi:hypothetical protein